MEFDFGDQPESNPRPASNLIPIGKYKGQPLEVLASDPNYADWLVKQAGMGDRYPQLVQFIVNNFGFNPERFTAWLSNRRGQN